MRDNLGVRMGQTICFKSRLSDQSPWRFYTVPEQVELLSRLVLAYRRRHEPVGAVFMASEAGADFGVCLQNAGFHVILKENHLVWLKVSQEKDDQAIKHTFSFSLEHIGIDGSLDYAEIDMHCSPDVRALFKCEFEFP
jgi:hypothetical protein